jgi:SAM-dependent methyltransferase
MTDDPAQVGSRPATTRMTKVDIPPGLADLGEVTARRFESLYAEAGGDPNRVPWCRGQAHPLLVDWLNSHAPRLVRPGSRALVVGSGLGDDVVALDERGYDVLGFDVAPTAVRWAGMRYPRCADHFIVADLMNPPARLQRRFDLVIEVDTLECLPPEHRACAAKAIAGLLAPRGVLLAIERGRDDATRLAEFTEPPFPFTVAELVGVMAEAGLAPCSSCPEPVVFEDDEDPRWVSLRAAYVAA